MIQLVRLHKRYGEFDAVQKLSLEAEPGEVFGFVGPNGAGKTTTIRMMLGLLAPTSGRVLLGGNDLQVRPIEAKRLCGFVPDRPHLYEKLTGAEMLDFVAGLYQVPAAEVRTRREEILAAFGLAEWAHALVESYSHGMKQRLAVAAALIHAPRILVLDEPMVGMDPRGARMLKAMFRQLAAGGVTVFLSTHNLDVAEQCCDRIAILNRGRLAGVGTLAELRGLAGEAEHASLETVFLRLTLSEGNQLAATRPSGDSLASP